MVGRRSEGWDGPEGAQKEAIKKTKGDDKQNFFTCLVEGSRLNQSLSIKLTIIGHQIATKTRVLGGLHVLVYKN